MTVKGIGVVCLSDSPEEEIVYVDNKSYQPVDWRPFFVRPTSRKPRESYSQESLEQNSSDNPPGDSFEEKKKIQEDSTNDTLQGENKEQQQVKQEYLMSNRSPNGVTNSANTVKSSYRETDGETGEYNKQEIKN